MRILEVKFGRYLANSFGGHCLEVADCHYSQAALVDRLEVGAVVS